MHRTLAYLSLWTQWRLHVKHEDPDSEAFGQQLKGKEFKSSFIRGRALTNYLQSCIHLFFNFL